jgi:hypothetical protein
MKATLLISLSLMVLASCHSTKIVDSWRDPSVTINTASLKKFVVAALLKNQAVRRQVEDQMASLVPGKAVQSYQEFGIAELKENDEVYNQQLKSRGFDGIVVMRVASVDSATRYVHDNYPTYYGSWRRYWGVSWSGFYGTGYYTTDKTYSIEVTVYSLKSDKLVWSGISAAVNPSGGSRVYKNISNEVYNKMKMEGFLQ